MTKYRVGFVAALAVAVALAVGLGGCKRGGPGPSVKPKIGVLTILSGEASDYGTQTRNGLELAKAELDGAAFELVYKDTKADPLEAVRVFKELEREGVAVVIGPFTSTEVKQVGPAAVRAKIPLVTSSASADDLSEIGEFVFMMFPPNAQQGSDQALFAAKGLGAKKAGVLYRQNPYGETLRAAFTAQFKAAGGVITAEVGFPDGEENFRDRLKAVGKDDPDVLFVPAHDADTGRILRQAKEVNIPARVRFLGCDGSMSSTTLELAGAAAEGAIFSNVAASSDAFAASYRAAYGKEFTPYAASAYDALKIVVGRIQGGAKTGPDVRQALADMPAFDGVTGATQFTLVGKSYWPKGKAYRQFEVQGGKFELRK